ncbi:MAG: hypothetical protein ABSD43_08725 [Terracidiphilus sp.]|jgi:hypothetical protein
MRIVQTFSQPSAVIALIVGSSMILNCQNATEGAKSTSFSSSISMTQEIYETGQKPRVILTNKNISKKAIILYYDLEWRMHVEGEKGEPPLTYRHRQLRGEPGLPALEGGGPSKIPIYPPGEKQYEGTPPGGLDVRQFDLTFLYDLTPGQYTVYMEVQDTTGIWMRTNTVHFEIRPPNP